MKNKDKEENYTNQEIMDKVNASFDEMVQNVKNMVHDKDEGNDN